MARKAESKDKKVAKREQLILAAVRVFSKNGYHETKMQDIATEAGIGKGTIYEYFKTKDDLFLAVYDSWMDEFELKMKESASATIDPVSKADALIDTAIEFYEHHAEHAPILLEFWAHALRSSDPHFLQRIRDMKKTLSEVGSSVTKQLVKLKAFTDVDVESFALLELGISDGIFLQWVLDGQGYSLREAYKFRQSVIGAGLMNAPLRALLKTKTSKKLKEGFLKKKTSTK